MKTSRIFSTHDLTKGAMFIALMAIGANLTAMITIGTVPLTFQTVIAILAGLLLDKRLAAFSMIGYIVVGLIGIPVFAGFLGGFQIIASPTFGFLISFIIIAYVIGYMMERPPKPLFHHFLMASGLGLLINYLLGIPYLYFHSQIFLGLSNVTFLTVTVGMIPFFVKDLFLTVFTALLAPKLVRAVNRPKSKQQYAS